MNCLLPNNCFKCWINFRIQSVVNEKVIFQICICLFVAAVLFQSNCCLFQYWTVTILYATKFLVQIKTIIIIFFLVKHIASTSVLKNTYDWTGNLMYIVINTLIDFWNICAKKPLCHKNDFWRHFILNPN